MNFEINEEQEELRSAVRAVLEQECPVGLVRERVEKGGDPEQPWRSARELGWAGIAIPERYGGLGLGFGELTLVLEEHGYRLAPGPLLPTTTQWVPLMREAGSEEQRKRWLDAVASGGLSGSLAVAGPAGLGAALDGGLRAEREGEGWVLDGERHFVVEADAVDELIVAARVETGDGVGLFLVPRGGLSMSRSQTVDASRPLVSVGLDRVRVEADRVIGEPGRCAPALARALEEAAVGLAAEMVGTCQALLDRTLAYARQREQFGRAIGSFQAVQHKLADLFGAIQMARASVYFAAMTIAEEDPRRSLASSMAKVAAGDAQRLAAKEGIQIHGGRGFTWEQDVQLFVKRAKAGEALFGTSAQHRARIAEQLLGRA